MSDLWERLRRAQIQDDQRLPEDPPATVIIDSAPEGWRWVAPLVAERTLRFPLDPSFWRQVSDAGSPDSWKGVYCFDTETTGLSGGAGTVAFLVGWASLTEPEPGQAMPMVEIRQWFLRDLPGEPDLVAALDVAIKEAVALVSFNGASFDLPLLRTRWTMAGQRFPEIPHRDDLHVSRRLWKRLLDSCRLGRLEETVLGIRRPDDVPGSLVPVLWFEYLRQGAVADFATPLAGVLRHHAQDVYSLLCLDLIIASAKQNPTSSRWEETFNAFPIRSVIHRLAPNELLHPDLGKTTPVDFWGLLPFKDESNRRISLERAWTVQGSLAAGLAWADHLKRRGDPQAVWVWQSLWTTYRSYLALVEWLKWLEHKIRSPESRSQALVLAENALKAPFLPQLWRGQLEKRRNRLAQNLNRHV